MVCEERRCDNGNTEELFFNYRWMREISAVHMTPFQAIPCPAGSEFLDAPHHGGAA